MPRRKQIKPAQLNRFEEDLNESYKMLFCCKQLVGALVARSTTVLSPFYFTLRNEFKLCRLWLFSFSCAQVKELVEAASLLSKQELDSARAAADAVVERLIRGRRLDKVSSAYDFALIRPHVNPTLKVIVHIDMDMFYAAVEMRDQPSLRVKSMAVGTTAMLTTSNYKVFFIVLDIDFLARIRCLAYSPPTSRLANLGSEPRCQVSLQRSFAPT